ncbi:MAG TPA: BTAD domain-containing putative transcriptional regulator [Thermodesulfobacteriota bacterium]|nr:BTAD domain-containing putative transcriptional regulator [Thermodesulfobacteriota bacterium]
MGEVIRPILRRVLPRGRLFKLLDGMRERPAIWVSGPPGCGKTTLVNSYLEIRKIPCLWYQIEEADADAATFLYYVGQAERRAGGREQEPLPLLTPEYLQGVATFARRYFENLYRRLNPPGVIVLDNYHNVAGEPSIQEIIVQALSAIPEGLNFIFISRSDPPPALLRLQADQRMETLGWDKLRFTLEETGEIVRLRNKKMLDKKEIVGWHKASDGWIAGLMLMCGRGRMENSEIKPARDFIPEEAFEDSATKVFDRAGKGLRYFLLRTSFFPQMTAKMAQELTGLSSANRILSLLSRNGYFTAERIQTEPLYQYHPLLREFLFSKAKDIFVAEEMFRVQQKAAQLLEGFGLLEDAAKLYRAGKDWDNFIHCVLYQARFFGKQGRLGTLQEWILSIPKEMIENNPSLLFWLGTCQLPFNSGESIESFKKAFSLFQKQGDVIGSYLAWSGVVIVLTNEQNDCALLAPWVEWLTEQLRLNPHFPSPEIEARVAVSLAGALLLLRPQHPDLENWMERSLELSRELDDVNLNIRAYINAAHWCQLTGDMARCGMIGEKLEKIAQSPSASPVLMIVRKWMEAWVLNLGPTADYDTALRRVQEGMKSAGETGIPFWNAMLLTQAVVACLNKGDLAKAGEFLREISSHIKSTPRLVCSQYHYLSAWYHHILGDYSRALFDSKTAVNLAKEIGSPPQEMLCRLEMAHILKSAGEMKNATLQLNLAGEQIPHCGSPVLEYLYLMAKAQFSLDEGEESPGLELLRRAMALGRSQGYISMYYWWDASVMSRLCAKALGQEIEVEYVRNLVRKRGLRPDTYGRALEDWPWPLKIFTLGQFKLEKDGRRLVFPGKGPQKALLMLKTMIALGGKEVREELVTDLVWPESEGDTAHIGFKTLLSRLRQLLGVKDAIEYQGGKASLNPEICWVDTWAFEEIFLQAKKAWEDKRLPDGVGKALRLTEVGLNIYKGNFLQCDQEYDWTSPQRERLRRKFLFLIGRLGEHLQEAKRWKEAADHYEKAIEVDPLPEEFYQNLMLCYLGLDQGNEGIAVYRRFRKMISESTGILPSRKTETIYQSLLNSQTPYTQAV